MDAITRETISQPYTVSHAAIEATCASLIECGSAYHWLWTGEDDGVYADLGDSVFALMGMGF